jgi:hypothetical protein
LPARAWNPAEFTCTFAGMSTKGRRGWLGAIVSIGIAATFLGVIFTGRVVGFTQNSADFPQGYDAVTAAPASHKVIFENALVRVLEVTMPPPGKTEPMHHHHWPSFFLDWDTGGKSPHIHYHQPGNIVRDAPSTDSPVHAGHWSVHWMKPEPMHAIETIEDYYSPNDPPSIRVEIKVRS